MSDRSINLTFHGIGPSAARALDAGEGDVWVSRERFLAVLDAVADRPDVHITFDDGNASDLEHGLPALRERGLSGTFFVVAGRLGTPEFLSVDDVRELAAAGMEIGCHGMHHRAWRGLTDAELTEELVTAKAALEQAVGRPVTRAACPFGSYDRRVLNRLRAAGYTQVYTSDTGLARPGAFLQTRTSVHSGDGAELVRRIETSRETLARRAKQAVKRWR